MNNYSRAHLGAPFLIWGLFIGLIFFAMPCHTQRILDWGSALILIAAGLAIIISIILRWRNKKAQLPELE